MKILSVLGMLAIDIGSTSYAGTIRVDTSFSSGDLFTYINRQENSHAGLSSEQLNGLVSWLQQHRSGWHGMITESSSESVLRLVNLKSSDGAITSICIVAQADGGHYLRVTGLGQWAYQSFGGFFKSWAATHAMSESEFAAMDGMLGGR